MASFQSAQLFLWPHRLLYVGPGPSAQLHRHHAAQLCCSLSTPLQTRSELQQSWVEHQGFAVLPDRPHAFEAHDAVIALLFLEAEGAEFAALTGRIDGNANISPFDPSPDARRDLSLLATQGGGIEEADAACRSWMGLAKPLLRPPKRDPRLDRALELLPSWLDRPVRLSALANAVHVSSSWLSHRLAAETGVPLRRYVVWLRLRRAVEAVLQGASWTEAAHAAGFSDSAHLSRSFRSNFGIAPSELLGRGQSVSVYIDKT